MLESAIHRVLKVFRPKRLAGVHLNVTGADTYMVNAVVAREQKSNLEIETKIEEKSSLEALIDILDHSIPVILTITGRGVLYKKIDVHHDISKQEALQKLIPGAKVAEFLVHISDMADHHQLVTIIRKEQLQKIKDLFTDAGFAVIDVQIGPLAVQSLIPLLEEQDQIVGDDWQEIGRFKYQFHKNSIIDFKPSDEEGKRTYRIGNEQLSSSLLLPLASVIPVLADSRKTGGEVDEDYEQFLHKRAFNVVAKGALAFFFVILLVNYIVFSLLYNKNQQLSQEVSYGQLMLDKYEEAQKKANRSEQFLKNTGWLDQSRASFHADRIAASKPEKIRLQSMNLYPVANERRREDEAPVFNANKINIEGTFYESLVVNEWINKLKEQNWVNDVEIMSYQQDRVSGNGTFELHLVLN